ncbi:MAG: hypothetical protein V7678_14480, partial [Brevundimonas sp.]
SGRTAPPGRPATGDQRGLVHRIPAAPFRNGPNTAYLAVMARAPDHPNDPGRWTLVQTRSAAAVWRREREDPWPVTMFYLVAPPRQPQVLYDEASALALLNAEPETAA